MYVCMYGTFILFCLHVEWVTHIFLCCPSPSIHYGPAGPGPGVCVCDRINLVMLLLVNSILIDPNVILRLTCFALRNLIILFMMAIS